MNKLAEVQKNYLGMTKVRFVLGDKLPWVSEMVLAIVSYAPGGSPKVNKETTI